MGSEIMKIYHSFGQNYFSQLLQDRKILGARDTEVYQFPTAAIANYKSSSFKQYEFIIFKCGGQKSKIGFIGVKGRCQQSYVSSGSSRENLFFPCVSRGCRHSSAPSHSTPISVSIVISLSLIPMPLSFPKRLHWAHLDNPYNLPSSRSSALSHLQNLFCQVKKHIHRFWGWMRT